MTRTLESTRAIRPAHFAHFVIRVRDLQSSIDWYEKVIGMEIVHRGEKLAFMSYDDEHHRVALAETPVEHSAPSGAPGLDHVAYTFETLGDLLSTYRRLEASGIKPYLPINHGPTTSLYYRDPDDNGIEFQVDNFETAAELKGWMQSEAFLANPLGVPFDPERLVERYLAGDPIGELLRQGAA